jgi:hypothetical protein
MISVRKDPDRLLHEKTIVPIDLVQPRGIGGVEYFELVDGEDSIKISASFASLNEPNRLENVNAEIFPTQGRKLTLTSDEGTVDRGKNIVSFEKDVIVKTTEGITLYSDQLYVSATEGSGESPGRISVKGASWDLTADSMQTRRDEHEGKQLVLFKGNVKLIYLSSKEN